MPAVFSLGAFTFDCGGASHFVAVLLGGEKALTMSPSGLTVTIPFPAERVHLRVIGQSGDFTAEVFDEAGTSHGSTILPGGAGWVDTLLDVSPTRIKTVKFSGGNNEAALAKICIPVVVCDE